MERSVAESGEEGSGERQSGTRLLLPLAATALSVATAFSVATTVSVAGFFI
jgi:hypothetical protein